MNKQIKRVFLCIVLVIIVVGMAREKYYYHKQTKEIIYNAVPIQGGTVGLCYHYIHEKTFWNVLIEKLTNSNYLTKYTVYRDEFEKQIDILIEEGAYFATLEEIEQFRETGEYPDKCVWICFDDGEESVYTEAFPYLKEKQIPFTMFIIAGQVGNQNFGNLKLCTWEQLNEMKESGLVSFGSHTYDMHYLEDDKAIFLEEDMYDEFYEDIKKSKEVIEENLDVKITSIAYPFGNANEGIVEKVRQAGFENAFILAPYPLNSENDAYYQNRYLVDRYIFYKIFKDWINNKD